MLAVQAMLEIALNAEMIGKIVAGAIGAAATFALQAAIKWYRRPQLTIQCDGDTGFRVHRDGRDNNGRTLSLIWLRVRVRNAGRSPAKNVQVFLTRYGKLDNQRVEAQRLEMDPAPLFWTHSGFRPETADRLTFSLPPRSHMFVDFVVGCDEQYPPLKLNSPVDDGRFLSSAMDQEGLGVEFMAVEDGGHHAFATGAFTWEQNSTSLRWRSNSL